MLNKIKNLLKKIPMLKRLKQALPKVCLYLLAPVRRIGLKNRNFTLISNNCWAGFIYQYFNLPYNTPFIGLFIPAPSYIKLLHNFEDAMKAEFKFITPQESRYYSAIPGIAGRVYPIGLLLGDIEVHFLHYKTPQEAVEKWNRRKARINRNNMLVKFAEIDCCTPALIEEFDKLNFKYKICYTAADYPNINSAVKLPRGYVKNGEVTYEWKFKVPGFKELLNKLRV